jgi:hypothetical protein
MPRPCSGDLRRRVVAAALAGSQSREPVAGGGGAAVRGRPLDRVPLGRDGPEGGPARGQADAGWTQAHDLRRERGRAQAPGRGGQSSHPDRVPRPAGGGDRGAGPSLDHRSGPQAPGPDPQKRRACARPSRTKPRSRRSGRPGLRRSPLRLQNASSSSTRVLRLPTWSAPMAGARAASAPQAQPRADHGSGSPSWVRLGPRAWWPP